MKPRSSSWPVAVLFVSLMVGLVLQPAAVQGQQSKTNDFNFSQYSHSEAFPNIFAPYTSPRIPAPKLSNSERLHNLIRNGKLELSLDDAIALALENNLDIDVARYSLRYAQTDLLRTRAGQSFRGINFTFRSFVSTTRNNSNKDFLRLLFVLPGCSISAKPTGY